MENAKQDYSATYRLAGNPENDSTKQDPKEEDANTGNWEDQRDKSQYENENYDDDNNDNTGGAGSSGSAATNS